jgi:phosphoribosylaminoimidazole-succinocarboxamide synthase
MKAPTPACGELTALKEKLIEIFDSLIRYEQDAGTQLTDIKIETTVNEIPEDVTQQDRMGLVKSYKVTGRY